MFIGRPISESMPGGLISVVAILLIMALAQGAISATDIESDPTKRKGAGALFQIRREEKWGYMDKTGKIIIDPQFDSEGDFFHGLARVFKYQKWGYINERGKEAIPFKFDNALDFIGEIAPVRVGRKWGYIDLKGNWVVSPRFQAAGELFDGLARVLVWNRIQCGTSTYYTKRNAPTYVYVLPDLIMSLTTGCFPVDPRYGFVNGSGKVAIRAQLHRAEDFSEGLAAFAVENQFGYVDVNGNVVIAPRFESAENFSQGLAQAELNGKWGYIDKSGNWVIEPRFEYGGRFSEGLARVIYPTPEGRMGYIDMSGQMIIRPLFQEAWDFSEGLAPVWQNDQGWSHIDKSGTAVLKLKRARWGFSDGLTVVGDYPNRVYVDKTGQVVAPYEVGWQF